MYGLGFRVLVSLCSEQSPAAWHKAKLSAPLFKENERPTYEWVANHLQKYHALPKVETLQTYFPELTGMDAPEPPLYYLEKLENKYYYDRLNDANVASQAILKENQDDYEKASHVLRNALNDIQAQKYRSKILNMKEEGTKFLLDAYHSIALTDAIATFGWPYMDEQTGGGRAEDVISFVGRPAAGKTFLGLYVALQNWTKQKHNTLFITPEMSKLSIAERVGSMYTHCPLSQIKLGGLATKSYEKYKTKLHNLKNEKANLFIVEGNLAATVDDIFILADQFECPIVVIDGAYLIRHKNPKLDRFTRVAENAEDIKRQTANGSHCTFASWQFTRASTKKGKGAAKNEEVGLEDIGLSDSIGQVSSVVLGMLQEDGIETMLRRKVKVLKGRNGEVGEFDINWLFDVMDFTEAGIVPEGHQQPDLAFI